MKPYTVVGYWTDNNQPIVENVEADTPQNAIAAARQNIIDREEMQDDVDFVTRNTRWVEVFDGHQFGVLGNEEVLS